MNEKTMKKTEALSLMRSKGYRVTRQRKVLIDVIFDGRYGCRKEVLAEAHKRDRDISSSTVHRTLNTFEDLGIISRELISCRDEFKASNNNTSESSKSASEDDGMKISLASASLENGSPYKTKSQSHMDYSAGNHKKSNFKCESSCEAASLQESLEENCQEWPALSVKLDDGNLVTLNSPQLSIIIEKALQEQGYNNKIVGFARIDI